MLDIGLSAADPSWRELGHRVTASSSSNDSALPHAMDNSPAKKPLALIPPVLIQNPLVRQAIFLAGLAGLFAVVLRQNILFSLESGRLAAPPRYDDTTYLLDAVRRLNFELANGVGTFLSGIVQWPPHAPMSTLTAMAGFALFGPTPLSAYLANGWILALYIGVMAYISRPLATIPARLLFVAALLFAPVSHAMITEFRPDMAAGLLFAIAIVAIVSVDLSRASARRRLAVAAIAVVATIGKPSGVVIVIPTLGLAFAFSVALRAMLGDAPLLLLLRRSLLPIAGYIVLLTPFAIIWGQQTVAYIYQALVSNADVWKTEGSRAFHWTYHYNGPGGRIALRPFAKIGVWAIIADVVLLCVFRPRSERAGPFALYLTVAVIYVAMAQSAEKTPFQGSFLYLPFLLAVALAIVRVLVSLRTLFMPSWGADVVLAVFVVVLALTRPLVTSFTTVPAYASQLPPLLEILADRADAFVSQRRVGRGCPDRVPLISSTNPDPIPPETILFALAARGQPASFAYMFMARSRAEIDGIVNSVDMIVAPDPTMPEINTWLPNNAFAPQLLQDLKADPAWTGQVVGTVEGAPLWLFERAACLPSPTGGSTGAP